MRIVVTGGAGFIGANLVAHLNGLEQVDGVAVVDDLSTGTTANLTDVGMHDLYVGTIVDPAVLDEAFAGADAVVHLAARPSVPRSIDAPIASHHANATGTLEVLEAARRAGNVHVVVASSSSVYGANPTLPKSEDLPLRPLSPYAVSKLATEAYALSHQNCYGLPVLAFRFFNVFGPKQPAGHAYAAVVPAFVDAALAGRPIPVHGDGLQSRDFTYVGTVCRVVGDAVTRQVTSDLPINLAFGSRRTLLQVIAELENLLGTELDREHLAPRAGDVRHSQADSRRLSTVFPEVEPVDFPDGLAETVEWFRSATAPV